MNGNEEVLKTSDVTDTSESTELDPLVVGLKEVHEASPTVTNPGKGVVIGGESTKEISKLTASKQNAIKSVHLGQLVAFLADHEGDQPRAIVYEYLSRKVLKSMAMQLIDSVLANGRSGKQPLTIEVLIIKAEQIIPHRGTALLLCHNVTRAFARESHALSQKRLTSEEYYGLFDKNELGAIDPGDWFHFFTTAVVSWYVSTNNVDFGLRDWMPVFESETGTYKSEGGPFLVDYIRQGLMKYERHSSGSFNADAYDAWTIANSVSMLEGLAFKAAEGEEDVNRESKVHMRGARFGIETIEGLGPNSQWLWYVPKYAALSHISRRSTVDDIVEASESLRLNIGIFTDHVVDGEGNQVYGEQASTGG